MIHNISDFNHQQFNDRDEDELEFSSQFNSSEEIWEELFVANSLKFDEIFREWLIDPTDRKSEHVRLCFPSQSVFQKNPIVILCDSYSRFINPLLLPTSLGLFYQQDPGTVQFNFPSSNKNKNHSIPVHNLEIINKIPFDGICQSYIFDTQGIVLKPTSAYEFSVNSTSRNRLRIFVQRLLKDNHCALVKNTSTDNIFLLIPSMTETDDYSLLLKSVVTREILLPIAEIKCDVESDESEEIEMDANLDKIKVLSHYDPVSVKTSIFNHLEKSCLRKRSNVSKITPIVCNTSNNKKLKLL